MEDRFKDLYLQGESHVEAAATHLRDRVQRVLDCGPPMFDEVDEELAAIGIDRRRIYAELEAGANRRLRRSIERGRRAAEGVQALSSADDAITEQDQEHN